MASSYTGHTVWGSGATGPGSSGQQARQLLGQGLSPSRSADTCHPGVACVPSGAAQMLAGGG